MNIKALKGMKYPDSAVIKFFFKEALQTKAGKVIEFGCSNGNNLSLYYQYDYDVIGVDMSEEAIENANHNFENIYTSNGTYEFTATDMLGFAEENRNLYADVFTIPNVISYISKEDFIRFLELSRERNFYKEGATFFLRTRTTKDYRFGLGKKVGNNSFLMENDVTSEKGAICACYYEYELIDILREHLNLRNFTINHLDNQNLQNGEVILNSDIVIWGEIG
ncbi:MAG TPA: class I SAM-dependent methyltransferase [Arcobacter sp.]|nr:class I SAM-dependent methyltransferase [Arcobacter sp.]